MELRVEELRQEAEKLLMDVWNILPNDPNERVYSLYQIVCSQYETDPRESHRLYYFCSGFPPHFGTGELGHNINVGVGKMQRTLLHFAAEKNFQECTRKLLTFGFVDVNVGDSTGCTALHLACREGMKEIIKLLLKHPKVNINARDSTGCTPLHLVCRKGFEEITQLLLQQPESDVNVMDSTGCTPLLLALGGMHANSKACREGFQEIATWLLQHPHIDVNAGVITPFHLAAFCGNDWAVSLLVQHPDIDLYSRTAHKEMTALHMAACKDDADIVRMILDAVMRKTDPMWVRKGQFLSYQAYEQRLDVVKELLQSPGLDVNNRDERSFTALHLAVLRGHVTIVQLLLNHQNINLDIVTKCISDNDLERIRGWQEDGDWKKTPCPRLITYIPFQKVAGMTALHFALELVEEEAAIEDRSMEGMTGVVNVLLAHPNIDINIENENGESPLYGPLRRKLGPILIRLFGRYEDMVDPCVHLLRSYCKKGDLDMSLIDPVMEKLHTPLNRLNLKIDAAKFDTLPLIHKAVAVGKEELLSVLIDIQQLDDINAGDGEKRTPLHSAAIAGQMKSIQLLLIHPSLMANHEDLDNTCFLACLYELINIYLPLVSCSKCKQLVQSSIRT
ncbi:hypothetical protein R1sor_020470 [Riccia sorocarpa]|uniref:Uncharacterized protein n=1 Tax=Riccia sorocarpa TaxID=122646 RepID=A0ABD3IFD6_9MARC